MEDVLQPSEQQQSSRLADLQVAEDLRLVKASLNTLTAAVHKLPNDVASILSIRSSEAEVCQLSQ